MARTGVEAATKRPSAIRRGVWWASDYVYAVARQRAVLQPPWTVGLSRPLPPEWRTGSPSLPTIVLLPGVYEHWTFLRPLGDALAAAGHRVEVVHGLGMNRRSIPDTADRLARALAKRPRPAAGRVLVAHSKGGLIGKHLLVAPGDDAETAAVIGLVAVATPFGGSSLARLFVDPSIRAFRPKDKTIVMLSQAASVNAQIVSVFGPWDPHIPEGSTLDGATNVLVPQAGHFRVLGSRGTHEAVIAAVAQLRDAAPPASA